MRLASQYHLPCFGGSDSHKAACVGFGYTILQEHITTETELINQQDIVRLVLIGGPDGFDDLVLHQFQIPGFAAQQGTEPVVEPEGIHEYASISL